MLAKPAATAVYRAGEGAVKFAYCLILRENYGFMPQQFEKCLQTIGNSDLLAAIQR